VRQDALLRVTNMALRHKALSDEKDKCRTNLEAIFRSIKDAIITVDEEMVVVEINEAALSICGFSSEVIGQKLDTLTKGCHTKCLGILEQTVRARKPVQAHRIECQNNGLPRRVIDLSAYPLFGRQKLFAGGVMVLRDETRLAELEEKLQERRQFHRLVGESAKMLKVFDLIEVLADVETTVLITGESGTGKELAAQALHDHGGRSHNPLVKVNCSALPESLLESELFGHVKGAFTDAFQNKVGRFQKADGGTIFLDEIGDLSPKIQMLLLRVLQQKEFEPVGDSTTVKVDVRVIASTNSPLGDKVKRGAFREDLYYRLNVVELPLPPLRERREDIPLLVNHFFKMFNRKFGKKIEALSSDVEKLFGKHPWPGNVRQLEHALEHAFVLCRQNIITTEHLPPDLMADCTSKAILTPRIPEDEPQKVLQALEKTAWNKAKAARLLAINRKTLYRKITKYKLSEVSS
jgi:PAS domain S-box-containing protein